MKKMCMNHADRPALARDRCGSCYNRDVRLGVIELICKPVDRTATCALCGLHPVHVKNRCWECCAKIYSKNRAAKEFALIQNPEERAKLRKQQREAHAKRMRVAGYRETQAAKDLMRKFGITPTEKQAMIDSQGGACSLCKTAFSKGIRTPCIDHDHSRPTSRATIRSILCRKCNLWIGHADDRKGLLEAGIAYLTLHALRFAAQLVTLQQL
jgi:hypothetical protein